VDPATSEPVISTSGLTKHYGNIPALNDLTLDVRQGEIFGFLGPNGAGKSTLIRCFLGFERPTKGFVTVDGIDPARDRAKALSRVGYVGQETGLYRQLTANEHLELAGTLRPGFDRAGAAERLADRDISLTVPTAELSGGQQAQVALSLALGTRAPVLLLDEPVARLDPLARRDFLTVLHDACRSEGITVLLASHIIGDLEGVSDSLIVLAPAAVVFHGSIDEARAGHAVVPASGDIAPGDLVATYTGITGRRMSLIRRPGTGDASLDDVVLGYLAASTTARAAA